MSTLTFGTPAFVVGLKVARGKKPREARAVVTLVINNKFRVRFFKAHIATIKVKKICCHNLFCVVAGLTCTDSQADLEPDLYQLMTSAYLEDKQLFLLQVIKNKNKNN